MQGTPFVERYFQGLVLVAFCFVAAWTFLGALFSATRLLALATSSRRPAGLLSELSGPAGVFLGVLMLMGLWKLHRFVRKRGALYPPE